MKRLPTGIENVVFFDNGDRLYKLKNGFVIKASNKQYSIMKNMEIVAIESKLSEALRRAFSDMEYFNNKLQLSMVCNDMIT